MAVVDSTAPASQAERFQVIEIDEGNAGDMRQLFARVFDKPMTEAWWQWKYRQSNGHGIGVWAGKELIAHYGGAGLEVVFNGKPVRAVQICDVMVAKTARHAVRQRSPLFLATRTFLERFVGYDRQFPLAYGFPSNRALQMGVHLGFYAVVGSMCELKITSPKPRLRDWLFRLEQTDPDQSGFHAGEIDLLWEQMLRSLPSAVLVKKNAARLRYRYLDHPEHRYHLWLLKHRLSGKARAAMILKEEQERILLMDVIGDCKHLNMSLQHAGIAVQQRWHKPLVFWLSTAQAEKLQITGTEIKPLPISTPANIWTAGPTPDELRDRWWLTAGDTDYL